MLAEVCAMSRGWTRIAGGAGLAAGAAALSYPLLFRRRCLIWGARPEEVTRGLPGDELLAAADIVSTRAITIASVATRLFNTLFMEPGSLVMERKMLLGIKERAERLARQRESADPPSPAQG
jgi:hypothetical protein